MKKLQNILILPMLLTSFLAQAQTETVAFKPKKLQQLYLSVGTGPAVTTDKYSNPMGGTYQANITAAIGPASVFRLNVQHAVFSDNYAPTPGPFDYFNANGYYSEYHFSTGISTLSLSYGKRQKISNLVQIQGLAGIGVNGISMPDQEWQAEARIAAAQGQYFRCSHYDSFTKPALVLQAEAMFLPSKFAGLTAGAYANLTPKLPTFGINLSVNLGLLK